MQFDQLGMTLIGSMAGRVGHLHINVNDLPWLWADASDNNTVDIAGFPPGEHKVKIDLVDANHEVFPGQSVTRTFTVPAQTTGAGHRHMPAMPSAAK